MTVTDVIYTLRAWGGCSTTSNWFSRRFRLSRGLRISNRDGVDGSQTVVSGRLDTRPGTAEGARAGISQDVEGRRKAMNHRETILGRIRQALADRSEVEAPPVPEVWPETNPDRETMMRRFAKTVIVWTAAGLIVVALISAVLPWAADRGHMGRVIQDNVREGRDASGLFYTEVEGMDEYEARVDAMIHPGHVEE